MLDLLLLADQTLQTASSSGLSGDGKIWAYVGFLGLVVLFLARDRGVFHREAHEVHFKEALTWSIIWVTCGITFAGFVYFAYERHWLGLGVNVPIYNTSGVINPATGNADPIIFDVVGGFEAAKQYLTGYVVEKSLSMDNVFVIAMLFGYFAIPNKYQHRVLFWGIVGALLMRGIMIFLGAELVMRYMWLLIFFGLFLIFTAAKMAIIKSKDNPGENPVVRIIKKLYPVTDFFDGQRFITRRTLKPTYSINPKTGKEMQDPAPPGSLAARWAITPLFLALIMVEITDLIFAVDSIPAIFAITPDPFIVFTSNIFAILGLRALYFCLAALIEKFRFLKPALIVILAFVGVKLLLLSVPPYLDTIGGWIGLTLEAKSGIKISTGVSLGVVLGMLTLAVIASILFPAKSDKPDSPESPVPAQ